MLLIALEWPNHSFHEVARIRIRAGTGEVGDVHRDLLDFVRLSCTAAVLPSAVSAPQAVDFVTELAADRSHVFLVRGSHPSHQSGVWDAARGPKQIAAWSSVLPASTTQDWLPT